VWEGGALDLLLGTLCSPGDVAVGARPSRGLQTDAVVSHGGSIGCGRGALWRVGEIYKVFFEKGSFAGARRDSKKEILNVDGVVSFAVGVTGIRT
jgi:hypothetical protein